MPRESISAGSVLIRLFFVVMLCLCAASYLFAQGLDRSGRVVDPIANANGRPVVMIFVRTDCPVSHRYAPEIQRLASKYSGKANFWLVYPSKDDSFDTITKDLTDYGYKLPALRDPEHALVQKAHAQITPEAALFDTRGKLVYHGRIDNWYQDFGRSRAKPTTHDLDDAMTATLDNRAVAQAETKAVGCYISDLR